MCARAGQFPILFRTFWFNSPHDMKCVHVLLMLHCAFLFHVMVHLTCADTFALGRCMYMFAI